MTAPHLTAGHTIAGKYTVANLLNFTREVASYTARDVQGNDVVVKLYDPAVAQRADVMAKLDRTRQVLASLPQTHVVHVIDSGYDASTAAPFSVTRQLRQTSLATMVAGSPLSPAVVARIMSGVAESLNMARHYQVYHHGLKPTNIFVSDEPSQGVQLMDFGVSIVRGTSPTHEAYAACAPWWAPEQIQAVDHGDAVTDVFAAALVAFYALTGRSYWQSCQQLPPDLKAWQQELLGPRAPVSLRANEFGMRLSAAVDTVFLRCLAVSPSDRAQQVEELVAALSSLENSGQQETAQTMALPEGHQHGAYAPQPSPQATPQPAEARTSVEVAGGLAADGHAHQRLSTEPLPAGAAGYPPAGGAAPPGVTPGLPEFPPEPAKPKNKAFLPIAIVVGLLLVVGGALAGYIVMSSDGEGAGTAASAKPDGSAAASAASGSSADKPDPSAGDTAEKPSAGAGGSDAKGDGKAADAAGDQAAGGGKADEKADEKPDEDEKVSVKITCLPKCSVIKVGKKSVKVKKDGTFELPPGKHKLVLFRGGYRAKALTVDLVAGQPFSKKVPLRPVRRVRVPPSCGQFLNPCP